MPQIFSMALTFMIITNFTMRFRNSNYKILNIELIVLIIVSFYTYPHILIPLVLICSALYLLAGTVIKIRGPELKLKNLFSSLLVSLILTGPFLPYGFHILKMQLSSKQLGWSLPDLNPLNAIFLPNLLGKDFSTTFVFLSWTLLLISILFLGILYDMRLFIPAFMLLGILVVPSIRDSSFDQYQSWKLISSFLPIILVMIWVFLIQSKDKFKYLLLIYFGSVLFVPVNQWSSTSATRFQTSEDLVNLKFSKDLSNLKSLNIYLNNYNESMIIATILDTDLKLFLNSDTYFTKSESTSSCTLVRNDFQLENPKLILNKTYSLISSKDKKCKI
jgi:hypothetical protein